MKERILHKLISASKKSKKQKKNTEKNKQTKTKGEAPFLGWAKSIY